MKDPRTIFFEDLGLGWILGLGCLSCTEAKTLGENCHIRTVGQASSNSGDLLKFEPWSNWMHINMTHSIACVA